MSQAREHSLSLAFMRQHPAQAAGVLESLPVAESAVLFERAPARLGATVLAAMLPRRAARCLDGLRDARALELLAAMGTQATVAVLRHLPGARRQALVGGLPTTAALASSLLLGYAEDALGAWADPDVVLLAADTRAGDALDHVRKASVAHPLVFVADAGRRLAGLVTLGELLQAPAGATLATLMRPPAAVLSAMVPLAAAPAHPAWQRTSALPVVEAGERLVGVMTRDSLDRALRQSAGPRIEPPATAPALLMLGYWQALTGLLQGALVLLPTVPPLGAGDGQG